MSKITDWSAVITIRAFWAGYYVTHIDFDEEEDDFAVLKDIFGCDMTTFTAFDRAIHGLDADLFDESQAEDWNVLTIPFPAGYEWHIKFDNAPGIYHYVAHPAFPERLRLGYDDPHFRLPILRWAEVAPLAACARRHGGVTFDPRALYLLFYPLATLTATDDRAAARDELTQAWADFGLLPPDKVAQLVERVTWVGEDIHWRRDETLGWITDARHSYRNPENGWTPEDFARWNTFLAQVLQETIWERGR